MTYYILRKFFDDNIPDEEVGTGLTLEEAQEHCNSKESSSKTCTSEEGLSLTQEKGKWFDSFYEE